MSLLSASPKCLGFGGSKTAKVGSISHSSRYPQLNYNKVALLKKEQKKCNIKVKAVAFESSFKNQENGDVYTYEARPLKEGESKHTISVFVADEAGLINRVAGVFARRGSNIESLAVGLTKDKALFTIVVTGTEQTVANLVQQLSKLVKVRYVEDISHANRVERELVLAKLRVPAGAARTELLQLANIFRARVVDVSDRTLCFALSGDAGKIAAFQKILSKFGIFELLRTGRVALKRGESLLEPSGTESNPHLLASHAHNPAPLAHGHKETDVYEVDEKDLAGVWEVDNILDPMYSEESARKGYVAHTLNIEVTDVPGVLNLVSMVFSRRGYNIQSLAVGNSEREGMSRICMVVPGNGQGIQALINQLNKLVYVRNVTDLTELPFVNRELLLVKVKCSSSQRGELRDLVSIFRGNIVDMGGSTAIVEVVGKEEKLKAFTDLLEPFGVLEVARTGRVAMERDSGVNVEFLERHTINRVY